MQPANSRNASAGSAEPYWFEWKTGIFFLIELLNHDSDVRAVAFQLHGTKGWDDLGVKFRDGSTGDTRRAARMESCGSSRGRNPGRGREGRAQGITRR